MEEEKISEQQVQDVLKVWDFMEFSNSYRQAYYDGGSFATPDTINQQMQDINMNPVEADATKIETALKSPKTSEQILANYAEYLELTNMNYKRMVAYFPNMMAFNLTFYPVGITKESEFKSKEFKQDMAILEDFCSRFDYRQEFSKVARQIFRTGANFVVLRDEGYRYVLQELPASKCKITGRFDYGYLFDFNMDWFINSSGVDIDMYPRVFRRMLRSVYENFDKEYDPTKPVSRRTSTYSFWRQTSPRNGFWCFKIAPELATIVPYYSGIMSAASYQPVIKGLQKDKYFIEASKLLVGIVGMNKDAKSGQVSNQINMTPETLGKFLGVARKGLTRQIKLAALPVDDIKAVDFDVDKSDIDSEYSQTMMKQSVASSDPMYSSQKLNSHQSKLASAIDMNVVDALYPMFADFMEYQINKRTKKYKFRIRFQDMNIPDQKAERKNTWDVFSKVGLVDLQLAARCNDKNMFEYMRSLQLTSSLGVDKFSTFLMPKDDTSNDTTTKTTKKKNPLEKKPVGRPSNESTNDPTKDNDSTEASIARGSNDLK